MTYSTFALFMNSRNYFEVIDYEALFFPKGKSSVAIAKN